jgi:hypothetical protein
MFSFADSKQGSLEKAFMMIKAVLPGMRLGHLTSW